ncbi:MAG TPA: aminopeptidase, partial [Dehalococcoidia bacterium]|nr:aminopeptidase [Dehalococcoidia bacterium]
MDNDTSTNPESTGTAALTRESLDEFRRGFEADAPKKLLQNVVTQHDVNDVALSRSIVAESPHSFSIMLDDWSVTNQARSGRCWMFAGLNVCRTDTRNLLNVK